MIHSELMFFEIIRLYTSYTGEEQVDYEKLENTFYSLEELASNFFKIHVQYIFEEELEKLKEEYDSLFNINSDGVGFSIEDMNFIRSEIHSHLNGEVTNFDADLDTVIQNIIIYHDLGISAPIKEYQEIFDCNATIIRNYMVLAEQESKTGKISLVSFFFLKKFIDYFLQSYENLKYEDFPKLKVIFAYYNNLYLLDGDSDVINTSWYIALFSKDENQMKYLFYDRLFTSFSEEEEEYKEEVYTEDEDALEELAGYMPDSESDDDESSLEDIEVSENNYDEEEIFFQYYLVLLNRYLKGVDKGAIKDILTMKKYLLIAINTNIENYFLLNGSIDNLELPQLDQYEIAESSFMSFYLTCRESIDNFHYRDLEVNEKVYADMVISAIFIRSFLDLCIDVSALKEVENEITSSEFYKNPEYKLATSLVDDIIFGEDLHFSRNAH